MTTTHPLRIPPGLYLDYADRARVARAAAAAAQAAVDAIACAQQRRHARRWEALAASVRP